MRATRWHRKHYWPDEDEVNERAMRRAEAEEEIRRAEEDRLADLEDATHAAEEAAEQRRYEDLLWNAWEMSW